MPRLRGMPTAAQARGSLPHPRWEIARRLKIYEGLVKVEMPFQFPKIPGAHISCGPIRKCQLDTTCVTNHRKVHELVIGGWPAPIERWPLVRDRRLVARARAAPHAVSL